MKTAANPRVHTDRPPAVLWVMAEPIARGVRRRHGASERLRGEAAAVGVCSSSKGLRIPYHNKADGFMAALVLTLNQVKFCELHGCQPQVFWGPFPACKYAGVRFPGRTPFYDRVRGGNAFEYFFRPICRGHAAAQQAPPSLSCEQREKVHRVLPWAVRTYYYGADKGSQPRMANDTYDEDWYGRQRAEGARLVSSYLRLQPRVARRLAALSASLLDDSGSSGGNTMVSGHGSATGSTDDGRFSPQRRLGPVLGVHLRGTDKGRYASAGSGRAIGPAEYEPYVHAFLRSHGPNASVLVATDSPSYLAEVRTSWEAKWPGGRIRYRGDVLRHEDNVAFHKEQGAGRKGGGGGSTGGTGSSNYRKGEEVLLDTLLLSRCDFLLHSASGVAEFAIYWSPALHKASVHLQYTRGRQQPAWMTTSPS